MKRIGALQIPTCASDLWDPTRLALLIYDMQVGVCRQVPDAARVVLACQRLLSAARRARVRVAYTRHLSLPKAWMGVSAYRMAMGWQRKADPAEVEPWFVRGSPGFELWHSLEPRSDEVVFDKLAMSAFEGTPLATALRDAGVDRVAICGIALEIGIDPSLRHAADLGFTPVLVHDACGWGHEEAAHRAVESLRFTGDTMIVDVDTMVAGLDALPIG